MSDGFQFGLFPELPTIRLLDEKQAAHQLNVEVKTLQYWRWRGGGPAYIKLGRLVRYDPQELLRWIQENRKTNTSN